MKTLKVVFVVITILAVIFVSGCVSKPSSTPIETQKPAENTEVVLPTPTRIPEPTVTPTPEPTPEPTEVSAVEKDLDPIFVQKISQEYMGVLVNAEIVTDKSLVPNVKEITISDDVFAEFIARTVFRTWWVNEKQGRVLDPAVGLTATEDDFINYMNLWSQAQKSGSVDDWSKVQLNNVWANDLTDGNGYVQEPYIMWPMYEGQPPEGVFAVTEVSFDVFEELASKNLLGWADDKGTGYGISANLDNSVLMIHICSWIKYYDVYPNLLALTWWWLSTNDGTVFIQDAPNMRSVYFDEQLANILGGGLVVKK